MRVRTIAVVSILIVMLGGGVALASARGHATAAGHHRDGTVTGKFEREGGPIPGPGKQPPVVPLSGTIRFTAGHHVVRVHVGASGKFRVRLAPGTYRVTASTPELRGPAGKTCHAAIVKVRAGHTSHLTMACIVP